MSTQASNTQALNTQTSDMQTSNMQTSNMQTLNTQTTSACCIALPAKKRTLFLAGLAVLVFMLVAVVMGVSGISSLVLADEEEKAVIDAEMIATFKSDGTITIPTATIKNVTDKTLTVVSASISSDFDFVKDWSHNAADKKVAPGESLEVAWVANTKVSADKVKEWAASTTKARVGTITYELTYTDSQSEPDPDPDPDPQPESDPQPLPEASIEGTYTYTGSAIIPEITDLENLKEDTDYAVECKDNVNAGKAKVVITGMGDYIGSVAKIEFTIAPKEVEIVWTPTENPAWTYDGSPHTPTVTLAGLVTGDTCNAMLSYADSDSKELEDAPSDAGTYTVTVSALDNANYVLPEPKPTLQFVINPQEITDEQLDAITLALPEGGFVYDGNVKEPSLENLPEGVTENDYEVVYENNVSATESGASVTFTFKNNFFCSTQKALNFAINKAPITVSGITATNKIYDGSEDASLDTGNVIYTGVLEADKENLYLDTSALFGTFDDKNVGTDKTVTIIGLALAGDATKNYELASTGQQADATANITAREVTITWSPAGEASYPYDGATHTPAVTVDNVASGESLGAVLDYKDSSSTALPTVPSALGVYTITVTGLNGSTASNYALPTTGLTKDFTIFARGGFWFAPANAEDPEAAAFKGQTEIEEDMQVLHETRTQTSAGKDKTAVAAEYTNYMNGKDAEGNTSEVRLYTKWYGDTIDASGEAQDANKWVEMRIIQVGEHDADGSAVTFMPTHSLPTAKNINGAVTNEGGWENSVMRKSTMDTYVAAGMKDIDSATVTLTLNKVSTSGEYGDWTQGVITQDKFWLLSASEVFGTGDNNKCIPEMFYEEGSQYAWFASQGVNAKNGRGIKNDPLSSLWRARSGNPTAGNNYAVCCLRSPDVRTRNWFGYTGTGGDLNSIELGLSNSSVVPVFAM